MRDTFILYIIAHKLYPIIPYISWDRTIFLIRSIINRYCTPNLTIQNCSRVKLVLHYDEIRFIRHRYKVMIFLVSARKMKNNNINTKT